MDKHILIAYTTWTGATRTVAEAIAKTLETKELAVDVYSAREAKDFRKYDAVVLGISVHMGRIPGEMKRFVKRNKSLLADVPVAEFVVCLTMAENTEESRQKTLGYLEQVHKITPEYKPVSIGLFAGAVLDNTEEFKRLSPFLKIPVMAVAKEQKDLRDWDAIRNWAQQLPAELF